MMIKNGMMTTMMTMTIPNHTPYHFHHHVMMIRHIHHHCDDDDDWDDDAYDA